MNSTTNCATTVANESTAWQSMQNPMNLHYRFVFKTAPDMISDQWRERFYKFIAYCVEAIGATLAELNGTNQSVAFRVSLPSIFSPDEFARRLKILSANWARRKAGHPSFAWREDYEAVTLNPSRVSSDFSSALPN